MFAGDFSILTLTLAWQAGSAADVFSFVFLFFLSNTITKVLGIVGFFLGAQRTAV